MILLKELSILCISLFREKIKSSQFAHFTSHR